MARINIDDYIGKCYTNKYDEKYTVTKYLFKDKSTHCYEVMFADSKHVQKLLCMCPTSLLQGIFASIKNI